MSITVKQCGTTLYPYLFFLDAVPWLVRAPLPPAASRTRNTQFETWSLIPQNIRDIEEPKPSYIIVKAPWFRLDKSNFQLLVKKFNNECPI